MPNWSYNTIALQGKKETVHEFIKLGLRNSNLETSDDIQKDFALLLKEGQTKIVKGDSIGRDTTKPAEVCLGQFLSARTFLPMPDTFLMYDTTNHPDAFPAEIVKEQKEKYGEVGWYKYNLLTLGTKWNFGLKDHDEEPELEEVGTDTWRFRFYCETAWSMPLAWCGAMKKQFPELAIVIMAHEESNEYLCVGEVDEDGELDETADLTPRMDNEFKKWVKERETETKKIKANPDKMKIVKENVAKKINTKDISEKTLTNWEISKMVDEVCGEFFDDSEIIDELYDKFYEILNEKI